MTDTSSAELEREAEQVRARISETADQLRAKMSPGQLMDEVLGQFRGGDSTRMLDNLRLQVRDNPMALALIGSGVAWMLLGSGVQGGRNQESFGTRSSGARPSATPYSESYSAMSGGEGEPYGAGEGDGSMMDRASEAFGSMGDAVGTRLQGASDREGGMASAAGDALSGAGSATRDALSGAGSATWDALSGAGSASRDALSGAGSATRDALSGAGATTRDALYGAGDAASQFGRQARNTLLDVLESEPLVLGALGVAVGVAIGAMLPATEMEREHLGQVGEALKDRAGSMAQQGIQAAKQAAGEVVDSVREEADRQGLLPGDAPIGTRVEAVVQAASEAVEANVDRALGTEKND